MLIARNAQDARMLDVDKEGLCATKRDELTANRGVTKLCLSRHGA